MRVRFVHRLVFAVLLAAFSSDVCAASGETTSMQVVSQQPVDQPAAVAEQPTEQPTDEPIVQPQESVKDPNIGQSSEAADSDTTLESSPYLEAVRTFADNVLKYGRDTYGPKHTPLFVDGINIHTHEPVKWISPKGGNPLTATETEEWILSNFASQQTLLRTLDGLSTITGDPKYRDAAKEAIKYAFENLRAPNGLFYWGDSIAYDAKTDQLRHPPQKKLHTLKINYPFYELMWQVNPEATKEFIEAYWSGHVIDWSNLDFNRYIEYHGSFEEPWKHEYVGGPIFFNTKYSSTFGFFHTGVSLAQAGTTLYLLSSQKEPLIWSKRLIQRFIDTRHPKTGISDHYYNKSRQRIIPNDDLVEHFIDRRTVVFPFHPFERKRYGQLMYFGEHWQPLPWISLLLMGDMLGEQGKEFSRWALEELTAWGKASYRQSDNAFVPILTDGTNIEGSVLEKDCNLGPKGDIATPFIAGPACFWLYTTAYRVTNDTFMWQMVRNIAIGNGLGDIGESPDQTRALNIDTACSDVYALLGFLDLYNKTKNPEFLAMLQRIANNILQIKFHRGFFVLSPECVYSRLGCLEPLALLRVIEVVERSESLIPQVWPECPIFIPSYRYKSIGSDRWHIYGLTELPEVSWSLQELAHIGDLERIKLLVDSGVQVDSWDDSSTMTALQRASISGHKNIAEFLLAKGAQVDYMAPHASLHYAIQYGHKDIVALLLTYNADVNIKDNWGYGKEPLQIATQKNQKDIAKLLITHDAEVYIKDEKGKTPLFYAVENNDKDLAALLIESGADVNAKEVDGYTPLYYAISERSPVMVELLVSKGADVNHNTEILATPLHYTIRLGAFDIAKVLVNNGAKIDVVDQDGWTAFRRAVENGQKELVNLFVSKGADVSGIHEAACVGDLTRVKNLVEEGAEVNARDEFGWTPLYWAASLGQTEVAEFLINKGAQVDAGILHKAAAVDAVDLVELLVSAGVNINEKNNQENTALHAAAWAGSRAAAEFLITHGAEVNIKGGNGWAPLHSAAYRGHKDIVDILLVNGADATVKDDRDRVALQWAEQRNHNEIVKLLQKHGAREKLKMHE